ncbi:DEKNAAC105507 [Brettanomyces naardenensis]|uniref:DEKNAAC105507 n=1 Tax=Brettanomyces naardenensis TaxID=13370 RepID=A0A448YTS8_BRENA|nr:DEKNAAC105507 [Brettanomyces naardenensis]
MSPILKIKLAAEGQSEQVKRQREPSQFPVKSEKVQLTADKIMILASKEKFKRQRKIFKENGCQSWKFMMLPMVQIPLWVCVSYMLRVLTGWNNIGSKPMDPTLTTEGLGYLHDLALSDPYFVLPITLGIVALANVEWNFSTADLMKLTTRGVRNSLRPTAFDMIMTLARGSIIFLMAMATQAPAALVLYWISSNGFSLCQNLLMDKFLPIRYTPYQRFYSNARLPRSAVPLIKY